jgi:hypothetical protein
MESRLGKESEKNGNRGIENRKREEEKGFSIYLNAGGLFLMYSKALMMYSGMGGGWGMRLPVGR